MWMRAPACVCVCVCECITYSFSSDLAVYSVALKFHCHCVWITALCYLPPSSAFWSTLYVSNLNSGQTHILHTKWKNSSCLNVYVFMNYNDQHTGTTYSGPVVRLMMRYFYSVGCYQVLFFVAFHRIIWMEIVTLRSTSWINFKAVFTKIEVLSSSVQCLNKSLISQLYGSFIQL